MVPSMKLVILVSLLLCLISPSIAKQSFRPKALVVPVAKENETLLYLAWIETRTFRVPIRLTVDLGGQLVWMDCQYTYSSDSYRPVRCGNSLCSLAKSSGCSNCFAPQRPGCNNNTCAISPDNTFTHTVTAGELATDIISVNSTNGSNPGKAVEVRRFLFACAPFSLLDGLSIHTVGMAGLGRTSISFASQFASAFRLQRKFALCLASEFDINGAMFIGDGPYNFLPNVQFTSQSLTYTPLLTNPVSTATASTLGEPSTEYFIGVTSIKINDKNVPLNATLLSIDSKGIGGTKISTVDPYTVLEKSIYNAVTKAFIKEAAAMNIKRVGSVAPFDVCFSRANVRSTRLGYAVPTIYLTLQNKVEWSIFGANSIVQVKEDVLCLGIVNGGSNPRTSIVIGGYQIENNLLQFDLVTSRVGFSSLLFARKTSCANFNF